MGRGLRDLPGRRGLLAVALAVPVLALAACGGSDEPSGGDGGDQAANAPKGGGEITMSLSADWPTLDVQTNLINSNAPLVMPLYDRLIARNASSEIVPYVAESWEVTPEDEPTQVTFKLRDDVTCRNGDVLKPSDVAKSFERWMSVKKTGVDAMPTYFGPGPYEVSADDAAGTFTFKTETPFRGLLSSFANGGTVIYCPESIAKADTLETESHGSGPYNLVSAKHGSEVVYERNDKWTWGPNGTTFETLPEKLTYKIVAEPSTVANLLLTGGLNVTASSIGGPDVDRLEANDSLIYKKALNYHAFPLAFNMYEGRITNDESVRKALMAAVDPKGWSDAAFNGRGTVTNGSLVMPEQDCYDESIQAEPASIDRAKQILTDGGWTQEGNTWTKGGESLKIDLLGDARLGAGNEYLLNQFRQLGIDVKLRVEDAATYGASSISGDWDVNVVNYTVVSPEIGQDLAIISGKAPPNGINVGNTGRGDAEFQQAAADALRFAGEKGCEAFNTFNQMLLDKAYVFPMAMEPYNMFGDGTWDFAPLAQWFEVAYLERLK